MCLEYVFFFDLYVFSNVIYSGEYIYEDVVVMKLFFYFFVFSWGIGQYYEVI